MGQIRVFFGVFFTTISMLGQAYGLASDSCGPGIASLAENTKPRITWVVDTNVIYSYPNFFEAIGADDVVLPMAVLEELDRHKTLKDERAKDARAFSRQILRLIYAAKAEGKTEITLPQGGTLKFLDAEEFPNNLDQSKADHHILAVALDLRKAGAEVRFLSNDTNLVIRANKEKLEIVDPETYIKEKTGVASLNRDALSEPVVVKLSADKLDLLLKITKQINESDFEAFGIPKDADLFENQYIVFTPENESNSPHFDLHLALTRVWRYRNQKLEPVSRIAISKQVMKARSTEQIIALDLLLGDVGAIVFMGKAGTGKTLLAIGAAMAQSSIFGGDFENIVITRAVIESGERMGFLPGTADEKMDPYLDAFRDQLTSWIELFRIQNKITTHTRVETNVGDAVEQVIEGARAANSRKGKSRKRTPAKKTQQVKLTAQDFLSGAIPPEFLADRLIASGQVKALPISYIRGRTIKDAFMIVDEAQNLTRKEVNLIGARAGLGTKIVFLGDPRQRDVKNLTAHNNGLVATAKRLKGKINFGSVILTKPERSEIAELFSEDDDD